MNIHPRPWIIRIAAFCLFLSSFISPATTHASVPENTDLIIDFTASNFNNLGVGTAAVSTSTALSFSGGGLPMPDGGWVAYSNAPRTNNWSVIVDLVTPATLSDGGILSMGEPGVSTGFYFGITTISGSKYLYCTYHGMAWYMAYAISAASEYQIAATYDGSGIKCYVNGAEEFSHSGTFDTGGGQGYNYVNIGAAWKGTTALQANYKYFGYANATAWTPEEIADFSPTSAPPPAEIAITYPVQSSTVHDFFSWGFTAINLNTSTQYTAEIRYTTGQVWENIDPLVFTTGPDQTTYSEIIWKMRPLRSFSPTEWIAQPFLTTGTSTISGERISFTILADPFGIPPLTTTSTLAELSVDCSGNAFYSSVCGAFVYLFVPGPSSMAQFANLWQPLKSKPPAGYFYSLYAALQATRTTSSNALVDASTTEAFSGVFGPMRTGIVWLLWFISAMFIYKTASRIIL